MLHLVKFNLNGYVRVKLTEVGRNHLVNQHEQARQNVLRDTEPSVDIGALSLELCPDGYVRMQAWDFMRQLGPHMVMGMPPVCDMEVIFEKP